MHVAVWVVKRRWWFSLITTVLSVGAFLASFFVVEAAGIEFVTATSATSFAPGTELHLKVIRGAALPTTGTVTVALGADNGGQFGMANLSSCTDPGTYAVTEVTIASNATQRAFCYRNSTVGADTITATFTIGSTTEVATFAVVIVEPLSPEPPPHTGTTTPPDAEIGTTTPPDGETGTTTPPEDEIGTSTASSSGYGGGEGDDATSPTTIFLLRLTGDGSGTVRTSDGSFSCHSSSGECQWFLPVGATVTLGAIPDEDSTFENSWATGAGTCVGAVTPCSVTVVPGLSLLAHFDLREPARSSGTRVSPRRTGDEALVSPRAMPLPQVAGAQVSVVPRGAPATGSGRLILPQSTPVVMPTRQKLVLRMVC